jgi:hypothetical protein
MRSNEAELEELFHMDRHVVELNGEQPDTCDYVTARSRWSSSWIRCPVCMCMPDEEGVWRHKTREQLLQ